MQNYLTLMQRILDYGDVKDAARENLPRTKELTVEQLKFNLQEGFPLVTTKKIYTKAVIQELLWFLSGSTYVDELIKHNVNIWNEDGYKFYVQKQKERKNNDIISYEEWCLIPKTEQLTYFKETYNMGKIYGYHFRRWGKGYMNIETREEIAVDQLSNLIYLLQNQPNSRYTLVSAWNPVILTELDAALPSCHVLFQTFVREKKYLDLGIYQRSCDYMLGVPFNIASYAALIHILCLLTGYEPGILTWIGGSCHIYENHVEQCEEQLTREPRLLPTLKINTEKIDKYIEEGKKNGYTSLLLDKIFVNLSHEDFVFENYNPHQTIKAPLSTGLKLEEYKLVWDKVA